jgi:hypothetical protein
MFVRYLILLCLFCFWSVQALAKKFVDFDPDLPANTLVKVKIKDLHPTQAAVGYIEVEERVKKLSKLSHSDLEDYLKSKVAPLVIGPGNIPWIVDHHHLAFGLEKYDLSNTMYGEIKANLSHLSEEEFEKTMIKNNWTYLRDENGIAISFAELPSKWKNLKDDFYRSLSWAVQNEGGYAQTNPPTPFLEFDEANFLRDKVKKKTIKNDFKKAVKKALAITGTPQVCNNHLLNSLD